MSWTETAFPARMLQDTQLTGMIATFLGQPAVFPYLFIPPPDAPLAKPYIITESDMAYTPVNFKGTPIANGMRDIRIYGLKKFGSKAVSDVADRVATLFRDDKLAEGEVMFPNAPIHLTLCMSEGPRFAPVEGAFIGRLVRVVYRAQEL